MTSKIHGVLDAAFLIIAAATIASNSNSQVLDITQGAITWPGDWPRDAGSGIAMQAVIPVSSFNAVTGDELYSFVVQSSDDGSSGWKNCSRIASVGASGQSPTDVLTPPALLFIEISATAKFYRISITVVGTSPSLVLGNSYLNSLDDHV